jgi:hypothetical protein
MEGANAEKARHTLHRSNFNESGAAPQPRQSFFYTAPDNNRDNPKREYVEAFV